MASRRTPVLVLAALVLSVGLLAGPAAGPVVDAGLGAAPVAADTHDVPTFDPNGPDGTIYRLYRAYFLRDPDAGGFEYWMQAYIGGYSLGAISNDFARSAEFQRRYGALDDRAFLDRVYANVLGRAPDSGGYAYWLDQMRRGMLRGFVMIYFSDSAEFRTKTSQGAPPGYRRLTTYESDQNTVQRLFRDHSDAFYDTATGFAFIAANTYPGLARDGEDCRTTNDGYRAPDGYWEEAVADISTMERDDGWTMPDGPTAGQPIDGRLYILRVEITVFDPYWGTTTAVQEVHATVLPDGTAKYFILCR